MDELLIGNERWFISLPRVPVLFYPAGSRKGGFVLCVDAEIDMDALESAFSG